MQRTALEILVEIDGSGETAIGGAHDIVVAMGAKTAFFFRRVARDDVALDMAGLELERLGHFRHQPPAQQGFQFLDQARVLDPVVAAALEIAVQTYAGLLSGLGDNAGFGMWAAFKARDQGAADIRRKNPRHNQHGRREVRLIRQVLHQRHDGSRIAAIGAQLDGAQHPQASVQHDKAGTKLDRCTLRRRLRRNGAIAPRHLAVEIQNDVQT